MRVMASASATKVLAAAVKGLKVWNPELFRVRLKVPAVSVPDVDQVGRYKKRLQKHLLKGRDVSHLLTHNDKVLLLLDPAAESESALAHLGLKAEDLLEREICLDVNNWRPHQMLEAVLEEAEPGLPSLGSYSIIGHIAHVNLKEHHLPYKEVIGHILLQLTFVQLVVNKIQTIDNTFRNFAMEVLAGDPDRGYAVEVKENGCRFKFDFAQVYWNPRLVTEHERLVAAVPKTARLCDVFAGVGPFAVPAAKKGIAVTANDLNPHSFRWLAENAKLNKVQDRLDCVNKDGRAFIREDVKAQIVTGQPVHVAMNLPALAVEFLDAFPGLLAGEQEEKIASEMLEPVVHVYAFTKEGPAKIRQGCEQALGLEAGSLAEACQLHFVRNVGPNKDMFRASFKVPKRVMMRQSDVSAAKKRKVAQEEEERG